MTLNRAIELMQIELECVKRADACGRDCLNCELLRDADDLIEAYEITITAMQERD